MAEYRIPKLQKNMQGQPSQPGTAGNPASAPARPAAKASSGAFASALPDSDAGQAGPTTFTPEDLQDLTNKDLVKAFILSEVLGKPRSMRKARW